MTIIAPDRFKYDPGRPQTAKLDVWIVSDARGNDREVSAQRFEIEAATGILKFSRPGETDFLIYASGFWKMIEHKAEK